MAGSMPQVSPLSSLLTTLELRGSAVNALPSTSSMSNKYCNFHPAILSFILTYLSRDTLTYHSLAIM